MNRRSPSHRRKNSITFYANNLRGDAGYNYPLAAAGTQKQSGCRNLAAIRQKLESPTRACKRAKKPRLRGAKSKGGNTPRELGGRVRIAKQALTATASCAFLSTVTFRLQGANGARFGAMCPNGCPECPPALSAHAHCGSIV